MGQGCAARFAREGFHVVCTRRGGGQNSLSGPDAAARLEAFCAGLRAEGLTATARFMDGTKPEEVAELVRSVEAEVGPIHVAIYNIGAQVGNRTLEKTSYRIFEMAWRMGSLGAFALAKELTPHMRQRGAGTLIFTSATAAMRGNTMQHAHTAAMAGRRMLVQSLNHELGGDGIHCCHVVLEGKVDAPDTLGKMAPALYKKMQETEIPNDKVILPASVAETYLFIHRQPRNCWTHELELRPWGETAWFNTS